MAPSGDEVLLTCEQSCDRAWERFSLKGSESIYLGGSPVAGPGLSWSPRGDRFLTTTARDALLIWDRNSNQPIAELPTSGETIEIVWSNDGTGLLTRNRAGDVYWWNVAAIHNKKGLR